MRLLVTGAGGQLGGYLLRALQGARIPVTAWSGSRTGELFGARLRPVDLASPDQVRAAFAEARPTHVLHAAALSTVADCFRDPDRARQVNVRGSAVLAEAARQAGARLVLVSTDLVFDGEKGWYTEKDSPSALSIYGQTKAEAEHAVLAVPGAAVVRVSLLFGPTLVGKGSFFDQQVSALREGNPCRLFTDEWRTPVSFLTAAQGLVALVRSDFAGILHLGGPERLSRFDMGQRLAAFLGCGTAALAAVTRADVPLGEPRPRDASLDSSLWRKLFPDQEWPTWDEALRELAAIAGAGFQARPPG